MHTRARQTELGLDPVDELEQVILITAREGERADRVLHGGQSLVYYGQVSAVHGAKFAPLGSKVQSI